MDIGTGNGYPASNLSNFTPHPFTFDGVECASMEGLLQSFKFKDAHIQIDVCKLWGGHAKKRGSRKNKQWKKTQTLYWQGVSYPRNSDEYQTLLDLAFDALATNESFQKALLTHSMGRQKESDTVLTNREFCSRLMKIRHRLQQTKKQSER